MEKTLEELKQEATELGIQYNANIGATKLAEKIEEFYEAAEKPVVAVAELAKKAKSTVSGHRSIGERAVLAKEAALKTHIVVITDNDQRENNYTQVVSVSCSNDYFDLGTMRIPLNTPVEVAQGFIDVLKEIQIPMHVRDSVTGLGKTVLRHRYSIAVQDELKATE